MKSAILDVLTGLPMELLTCYFMCRLVTIRKKIWYTVVSILLLGGNYFVTLYLLHDSALIRLLASLLLNLICTRLFSQERMSRVALATGLMYLISCVCEVLVMLCYMAMYGPIRWLPTNASLGQMLLLRGMCLIIYALLFYPVLMLWSKRSGSIGKYDLFLIFPLSQGILLYCFFAFAFQFKPSVSIAFLLLGLACVCGLADWGLYRLVRKIEQQHTLAQRNAQLESRLKEQLSYYNGLQESMLRVNQMRHDMGNHIQTAYALLKQGDVEVAHRQLDQLSQTLKEVTGVRLCQNQVADAVLQEKLRECNQQGIALTIDADISSKLPIRGIDLCSLLANVLDNAIKGTNGAETPKIALRAGIKGGFFIVKAHNSTVVHAAPGQVCPADDLPEHGLGLSILREIAAGYGGEVRTTQEEKSYETIVWLAMGSEQADSGVTA